VQNEPNEILVRRTEPLAHAEPSIGAMLSKALDKDTSPEGIKALCDAFVTMDDRKKREEFQTAFTMAQKEIPPVRKDAFRVITAGVKAPYASRTAIQKHLALHLPAYGLSYSLEQSIDKEGVHVVCEVSHVNGQSKRYPYTEAWGAQGDSKTSKTTTTAIRGALSLAFGLVIDDPETPEEKAENESPTLTPDQIDSMRSLLAEVGGDESRFLKFVQVERFDDIKQSNYANIMRDIEKKRKAKP